jgi:hypothetical protein
MVLDAKPHEASKYQCMRMNEPQGVKQGGQVKANTSSNQEQHMRNVQRNACPQQRWLFSNMLYTPSYGIGP